jgi:transposase
MRYELDDNEWDAIRPMLPNKPRGVPRVDDRRVLKSIAKKVKRDEGVPRKKALPSHLKLCLLCQA